MNVSRVFDMTLERCDGTNQELTIEIEVEFTQDFDGVNDIYVSSLESWVIINKVDNKKFTSEESWQITRAIEAEQEKLSHLDAVA